MKKIIVVKIGSSVLFTRRNKLDEFRIAQIASQVKKLQDLEFSVVLIVSGAVAYGANFVDLSGSQIERRAAAGIGQIFLTSTFDNQFHQKNVQIAQLLLTKKNFESKNDKCSLVNIFNHYMKKNIVSFVNENDVVSLNSFNGNDYLAAQIGTLLHADQLIILSTMQGSAYGVGGAKSKLEAVDMVRQKNIRAAIVDGKIKDILLKTVL
ncbi:hypothetical protein A3A93_03380 [Candidatus Roizmanbacteria bacterium RIFCSPLOWO2_01_FULL_38_12]|uniref:Aspartate/glutamate/uridylate kinase domain-containing protein n=1 Tax=Candidatus Roizmanbacteria bacterium RIFCSPLOWO2_01_FULL_38_12 TaxID=1802061 RepID=A0A1F7ISU0_9BACT|nr:MAG: hypothetical protein A2861_01260 [Candidatus Roizmanbacteria bacterium RIFCSPHIGHO2_01_FULL_38_15]OGK35812.1 MAG: hypothetical protein A3F59_03665 [Candidatus Roizmanbacteria bacterium RIFCSPHIGHO2_12_FULL_38_13]OGK46386.1 MAG: hypothetical protein A3A93_03380 [Candidatus Roizmanbacteria bacterium RIFCSPLOWO2_01_FULL_38_12]